MNSSRTAASPGGEPRWRRGLPGAITGLCLAAALFAAAGCTARSGATTSAARVSNTPSPAPTPAPEPPPVAVAPPPPARDPEPPSGDICVPVHDGSCLPGPVFHEQTETRASEYLVDPTFGAQWGFPLLNLHRAYAHVELLEGPAAQPGAGVTIGFIDTGIDQDHPAFEGKLLSEQLLFGAADETGEDDASHGTAVASIAAGARTASPDLGHGVAWGSDIAMFAIPLGSGDGVYTPISLEGLALEDPGMASLFGQILAWRDGERKIDVLNLSFGYQGIIDDYSEADLRENFSQALEVLAQPDSDDRTIFVWAAGNSNGDTCADGTPNCVNRTFEAVSVSILPGLVARIEELQGHSVAVVALREDGGAIAEFSNRCGVASDFCIAAPGQQVRFAWFGPDDDGVAVRGAGDGSGTSFAAPMVSGGLAIMKQLFRDQLSSEELVSRLFATADDTGIYADRSLYGHGRMDLGAATSPIGVLDVPLALHTATGSVSVPLAATQLRMGNAFGSGITDALASEEIMALDDFGAPFWYALGNFAVSTDGPSLSRRLRAFLSTPEALDQATGLSGRVGPPAGGAASSGPTSHLALAEGALPLSAPERDGFSGAVFTTGTGRPLHPATGASVRWRPRRLPLGFEAGWVSEPDSLLGSVGQGAFGRLAASTAFFGLDTELRLGRWSVGAQGEVGFVRPDAQGGIIETISPLRTSVFEAHAATAFRDGSGLRLSLSQPLRVEQGSASLMAPTARTPQGEVHYSAFRADLAPATRQMDLAAAWNRPLALGELRLGAVWTRWNSPVHISGNGLALLSGWRWTF